MEQQKKTWQLIVYAILFLAAVLVLFFIYTTQNRGRIQEQNRIYAEDCARQTANRIESEFNNGIQRIRMLLIWSVTTETFPKLTRRC